MDRKHRAIQASAYLAVGAAVFAGLYLLRQQHYLLFHGVAEVFCVVVAFATCCITLNARQYIEKDCYLILGVGFLCAAALGMLHMLAYKGMPIFQSLSQDANLATQLWIAYRYVGAGTMLTAFFFLRRRLRLAWIFPPFAAVFVLLLASIFWWQNFPACWVEGRGLTPFKVISEYVIVGVFAAALVILWFRRRQFDRRVLALLAGSILLGIAAELAFTLYAGVYDIFNLIGHYFVIASFYLLYKALVETSFRRPYDLLFRNLKQREVQLAQARDELELRVAERTAVAERRAEQLQTLAKALSSAERHERERLARVLHDHLQQLLVAGRMYLDIARNAATAEGADKALRQVSDLMTQSIDATRSLSAELSPPVLHRDGLTAALEWLAEQMNARHNLTVELTIEEGLAPPPHEIAVTLYQAVRELLFNVVKHAGTDRARLSIRRHEPGCLQIEVSDQGNGFDPRKLEAERGRGGLGLFSLRDRLELIGGRIQVDAAPGRGTRSKLVAPIGCEAQAR